MNKFLASVTSLEEAEILVDIGVDILDLKQPATGALGALDPATITEIMQQYKGRCPISATIGDLPMLAEQVLEATRELQVFQLDYIKIGFFPDGDWQACAEKLQTIANSGQALIAVLFADVQPSFDFIPILHAKGFKGVMLDTMDKQNGSLLKHLTIATLQDFVNSARELGLLCGLAGSLTFEDIAILKPLQADYLGFRGALCGKQDRTAKVDEVAAKRIKALL